MACVRSSIPDRRSSPPLLGVACACAVAVVGRLIVVGYGQYMTAAYRRANRAVNRGPNGPTLGPKRLGLDLDAGELIATDEDSASSFAVSSIRRIEESASHHFVYLGPMMAIVVPRDDEADAFMTKLRAARTGKESLA